MVWRVDGGISGLWLVLDGCCHWGAGGSLDCQGCLRTTESLGLKLPEDPEVFSLALPWSLGPSSPAWLLGTCSSRPSWGRLCTPGPCTPLSTPPPGPPEKTNPDSHLELPPKPCQLGDYTTDITVGAFLEPSPPRDSSGWRADVPFFAPRGSLREEMRRLLSGFLLGVCSRLLLDVSPRLSPQGYSRVLPECV